MFDTNSYYSEAHCFYIVVDGFYSKYEANRPTRRNVFVLHLSQKIIDNKYFYERDALTVK